MKLPPVKPISQVDTHRLVPSKYLPNGDSVLTLIADDEAHLRAIFELDDATNDRLRGERGLLPGIGPDELLSGVPHASIVNATFCHAHPLGSRFNGPDRGAWYAGFELETSQAEVAFNEIHQSPVYPGGLALRFARVKRYRTDKTAAGADTIDRVRALAMPGAQADSQ